MPAPPADGVSVAAPEARTPAVGGAAAVALEQVDHAYGSVPSVRGIDLAVSPGEVVCLLGNSGCGKTTLLRLVAGLERPAAGTIRIDGRVVSRRGTFVRPERRSVGLMFQDYALFPNMTVLANVAFGLRHRPHADAEARNLLDRVGLARHAYEYPDALSGGERQRAALARALAPRPGILLMDEPFSGLDRRLRERIRTEALRLLRDTGVTVVLVTHDPEEAMELADRIVLMRDGRVVQSGPPAELYDRPADLAAARFFSPVNELPGFVESGLLVTAVGRFPTPLPDGPGVAAIRSRGISITSAGAGLPARVTGRRFLGEVEHVEFALPGLDRPLSARIAGRNLPAIGEETGIVINPADVLVFAKVTE